METPHSQQGFTPQTGINWLFFDLNSYFASVEQQDNPALRGQPVAVIPSQTDSTCAIAASYEAKAYGIKTGTKIYEAKKLCPHLKCVLARHHVYVDYHQRILSEVEKHIPISKVYSIDEAACRLLSNERNLDKALRLAHNIKRGLKHNVGSQIKCSIGLAPNSFLAKIATDMKKPDGLTILKSGEYHHQLFKMRLTDLCGIGKNIERRLNRAGVVTVEQFWNLAPKHARKIWGSVQGEIFWYRLHGYEIPTPPTQKRVVGHSRVLDPAFRDSDKAFSMAQQLTTKACSRLRRYNLHAKKFHVSVRTTNGYRWDREHSFSPTQDNFIVTNALNNMWQRMQYETNKSRLLKVSVTLHDLQKPEEINLDLFEQNPTPSKPQMRPNLSNAMDTLNKKFGSHTVNMGMCPKTSSGYVGTKIAFSRVPNIEEFQE